MNNPKDFQKASASHIVELFKHGHNRVLLSDEVGLGKTTVATTVVKLMHEWHNKLSADSIENDGIFKVVYVCSSQNIASQNITQFEDNDEEHFDIADSRLSMLHYKIYQRSKATRSANGMIPKQVIPLTPSTSLRLTNGQGLMKERALIYIIMRDIEELIPRYEEFGKWIAFVTEEKSIRNFYNCINSYEQDSSMSLEYLVWIRDIMERKLRNDYPNLLQRLCASIDGEYNEKYEILGNIRRMFAEISVEELKPDLVIMDEFQRFDDLLMSQNDEEKMFVEKFMNNDNCKILLLSATPYKPYTTNAEINKEGIDLHHVQFLRLTDFLFDDDNERLRFHGVWENYQQQFLQNINDIQQLGEVKCKAEDMLYSVISRTERFNRGIISTDVVKTLMPTKADVLSYVLGQQQLKAIGNAKYGNVPIEYVKSSPYILSFMDKYKLKVEAFEKGMNKMRLPSRNKQTLLIPFNKVKDYQSIDPANAKLRYLHDLFFGSVDSKNNNNMAQLLLWVPASNPYYMVERSCVFSRMASFSKVIVFSAWEMVPRMVSSMMSYYAEYYTIGKMKKDLLAKGERIGNYFNNIENDSEETSEKRKGYGVSRLPQNDERRLLLTYPSKFLMQLYEPNKHYGESYKDIKSSIKARIEEEISADDMLSKLPRTNRSSAANVYGLLQYLEGKELTINSIPRNATTILAEMAMAGPGVCALRITQDEKSAIEVADSLVSLFNRPMGAAVIDVIYGKSEDRRYYENVLHYCVMGNLQAVLDEYSYMSGDKFEENMTICAYNRSTPLFVDSYESFFKETDKKMRMRSNFAISFADVKADQKGVDRVTKIRTIFNSPFQPFILTTTSIGQEGLDFHWYARKIVHWNLPSNPIDLEQREGRINRYDCLSVRRNVAKMFGNQYTWQSIFKKAEEELNPDDAYSEIIPHWCLPPNWQELLPNGISPELIEPIVPVYPFSRDGTLYENMARIVSLYRMTLGQPRQEELLKLMEGKIKAGDERKVILDLSPIHKEYHKK